MEKLLELVSEGTKDKLEKLMEEQERIVGQAVSEALAQILKGPEFLKQIEESIAERAEGMVEGYLEWRLEDADYSSEEFEPLREFTKQGMKHLIASEKAKKLASEAIKRSIEYYFENLDEGENEEFDDDIREICQDLYRKQLQYIRDNGNLELNQDIRERISEVLRDGVQEKIDEDW